MYQWYLADGIEMNADKTKADSESLTTYNYLWSLSFLETKLQTI